MTLQNLMEARSHCDTVGPPGIKETIVTQVMHMKPRSHCDTLGFFPSALQLAVPAHCIMCQLLSSGLCLHTGPGEVFLFVRKEWKSLSRFPKQNTPHAQYRLPGMLSPFYKGHCEQE